MNKVHAVLGASGAMSQAVMAELKRRNLPIRPVERSKTLEGVETVHADISKPEDAFRALNGASHAYITIGLPYKAEVWEQLWPVIIDSLIEAAAKTKTKLVMFDNIYMYGPPPLQVPITEIHPQEPSTRKGKVRKKIADALLAAHKSGKVQIVIGRSASFYGPRVAKSILYATVISRMLAGKNPVWLGNPHTKQSFAFTPDNGRALVQLALDDTSYGEIWHLPVSRPSPTVREFVVMMNKILGTKYKLTNIPKVLISFLSVFMPQMKDVAEMLYELQHDYILSDQKFMKKYPHFKTTGYREGLEVTVESYKLA